MGMSTDTCMRQQTCKAGSLSHSCVNPVSLRGFYRQGMEQRDKVSVRGTELAMARVDPGSLAMTLVYVLTPARL